MSLYYLGKVNPGKVSFQSCCIPCLENDTALACYRQTILIFFVDSKVVLSGRLKTREWKTRHDMTGVENAGVENAARYDRGGKRGSGKLGTR